MSAETNIEWANHTGGPYLGCEPVSPGCANCYAWELALTRLTPIFRKAFKAAGFDDWETRPVWGRNATRVLTKGFWKDARRINAQHKKAGTRGRWFPSMIDWLDEMPCGIIDQEGRKLDPIQVLADFLSLVNECRNLDWLLLTKRPENWSPRIAGVLYHLSNNGELDYRDAFWNWLCAWSDGAAPSNVWLGTSVEDQTRADERIPKLLEIPAKVRFLSCEPLLGPVSLKSEWVYPGGSTADFKTWTRWPGIDWVICGGESGPQARPMHPDWARSLRDQCVAADVPFFFKQWGEWWLPPSGKTEALSDCKQPYYDHASGMFRVGKKKAGRLLDGREWNEFPSTSGVSPS